MFRAIFRIITLTVFSIILIIALAVWKGGEPFKWAGKRIEYIGRTMVEFGDIVDELMGKKERVEKTYKELKEIIKAKEKRPGKDEEGGATDKDRRSQ
jgi:hypothetical protein